MEKILNNELTFISKWYYQVILCVLFMASPFLLSPRPVGENFFSGTPPFYRDLISTSLLLVFFYLNYFVLIPKLYFRRKYILYALSILMMFICLIFLPTILTGRNLFSKSVNEIKLPSKISNSQKNNEELFLKHTNQPPLKPSNVKAPSPPFQPRQRNSFYSILQEMRHNLLLFAVVLLMSMLLRIQKRLFLLKEQKMASQLNYLKNQINPHFLFNTLNGVYSMAISGNKNTAQAIEQLSGFMRYMYNDFQSSKIELTNEFEFLENYIELQKIRFGDRLVVNKLFSKEFNSDLKIEPLLLIPFIENAFKYGVNIEKQSEITIKIILFENQLDCIVKNYITEECLYENSTKVGVKNTQKRLKILYPDKHHLEIKNTETEYIVHLKIEL